MPLGYTRDMETDLDPRIASVEMLNEPERPTARQICRDVVRIAWPSVLVGMLMTTNTILDRFFVGMLGRDSMAAVGVGGQVMFLLVSLSMAVAVGTTALVARFTGAREPEQVAEATGQSISLGLILGTVLTLLTYAGLPALLHSMGIKPPARELCLAFLIAGLFGGPAMFVGNAISSAFRAIGDTRTQLRISIAANIVHMLGDWTLMLGHWGAPRLGVMGGGIAMTGSMVVSMVGYIICLRRSRLLRDGLTWQHLRPQVSWARRLLRIGSPAAVTMLLRTTSLLGFTGVLARTIEGTASVASLPIGMTAESIAFMPGFGFSVAASALVGQALGARDPDRAERYGWVATKMAIVIMSVMGVVFYVLAEPFARVFTHDPAVVRLATDYLRIMAISEPALALGMVLTGALQGAGDTLRPTVATAVTFWVFRLPMAWSLALGLRMQAHGAWIAMCASTILGGVITTYLYRSGKWKTVKV
jgi:putative MATE family efflux protein